MIRNVYWCSCKIPVVLVRLKLEFSRQIFENSNLKVHENQSSGSQVVLCGQTDMTKLIVAFRYFANTPKNLNCYPKAVYESSRNVFRNFTLWSLVCEFCNNLYVLRHYL